MIDFSSIRDHEYAKRAIEIALAGKHSILLVGAPGCGKTMLTQAAFDLWQKIDGEGRRRPTNVDLNRLTEPDDAFHLTISTTNQKVWLLANSRACSCGEYAIPFMASNDIPQRGCSCTAEAVTYYQRRIHAIARTVSIMYYLSPVRWEKMVAPAGETSAVIGERIVTVWKAQATVQACSNDEMEFDTPIWNERMIFEKSAKAILKGFFQQNGTTARQYVQVVRVARTIADLAYHTEIASEDIAEAIQYMKRPQRLIP